MLWGLTLKAAALKAVLGGPTSWEVPKWVLRRRGPAVVLMVPASRAAVLRIALGALRVSRRQRPASRAAVLCQEMRLR